MQLGKVKPTATIVAQFAAGVEVEAIQHEGKMFLPVISTGEFSAPAPTERKHEPTPEAPAAPAKPSAPAKPAGRTYTKEGMMEMASKDLEKILRNEFGINPDDYDGKNTNKKLRDLILEAQKGGAKAAPAKEDKPENDEGSDNAEIVKKVEGILGDFDSGKLSRKKALSAIAEACDIDDTDAVSDLLDEFEDDGDASAEEFAQKVVNTLLGEGEENSDEGSEDEPEGEEVDPADLEKGDRVAVWWNDDNQAWYKGTVASVKRGKVVIDYDDETSDPIDPEIHTVIKRIED